MFEEPNEAPAELPVDPVARAIEKCEEFRMHAEFAAVFEGTRKFDARILSLKADVAREIQRTMGRLEKSKSAEHPVLTELPVIAEATALLSYPSSGGLFTNDYHINRRPGEVMIVRWLAGEQVDKFYERFQAHFDVAINAYREEERQSQGWKQDPQTVAYLEALESFDPTLSRMADRYLRPLILEHKLFVLSTQAADELDILHLSDYVMGVSAADIVGKASAPPEDGPTERDRAWFFKLFSLRGIIEGMERMCFFAYLQKAGDGDV